MQGIYLVTSNNKRLNGTGAGRFLTEADVIVKAPDMATGLLLGITVATKPNSEVSAALSAGCHDGRAHQLRAVPDCQGAQPQCIPVPPSKTDLFTSSPLRIRQRSSL